jgi:hypothetical protein
MEHGQRANGKRERCQRIARQIQRPQFSAVANCRLY